MATILLKRGLITNINNVTLQEGELALAYNADKTKIALYAGDGNGGKVLVNPDVIVPTKVSDLANDSDFQTGDDVATAIASAIAATGHASFKKVDSVPTADTAVDNVLYLVMNSATNHYDIYAKVGNEVVLLDDTTVDLSGYATKTELDGKVDKVDGKGLSTNDYTTADKDKLAGIAANANNYTHPVYGAITGMPNGDEAPGFGDTFIVSQVKSDNLGHVTEMDDMTITIPNDTATTSEDGLMSSGDKSKLDGIAENANNYTHPSSHAASMITQDSTHRFVTDAEKSTWNSKLDTSSIIDGGTF